MRRQVLGPDHVDVAESATTLASMLMNRGDAPGALPLCRDALAIERVRFPAGHRRLAATENLLGECLTRTGNYAEAESLLIRSHRILAADADVDAASRRRSLERVVGLYSAWGRKPEMERHRAELARMSAAGKG
jgi:hypothetical protein